MLLLVLLGLIRPAAESAPPSGRRVGWVAGGSAKAWPAAAAERIAALVNRSVRTLRGGGSRHRQQC